MRPVAVLAPGGDRFAVCLPEWMEDRFAADALSMRRRDGRLLASFPTDVKLMSKLAMEGLDLSAVHQFKALYNPPLIEGEFPPMPHQLETAAFLAANPRAYCTSEMRTGKTGAVVMALDFLERFEGPGMSLIVCPASIMDGVWRRAVELTLKETEAGLLRGTPAERRKVLKRRLRYNVINYEGLAILFDELMALVEGGVLKRVVIDELSHYGNSQTQRYKAANRLFNQPLSPVPHLWGLTGTPGADTIAVHGMCRLVNDREMPWKTIGSWRGETQYHYGNEAWMWKDKPCAPDVIRRVMQPNIRFTVESVLKDLPPLAFERREAALTKDQRAAYEDLLAGLLARLQGGEIVEASQKAALLSKIFQLAQGAVITDQGPSEIDSSERDAAVVEIVRESEAKTVVFRSFVAGCAKLERVLAEAGIQAARVDGSVTGKARDEIFRDFQNTERWKVLVAHPQTTAYGTELAAADQLVFDGPMMSGTHTYMQGLHRLSSSKQKSRSVRVVELVSTPEEARFFDALRAKGGYAKAVGLVFESVLEELGWKPWDSRR